MNMLTFVFVSVLFHQAICQTCMPYPKSMSFDELVVNSPIVVEATLTKTKLVRLQNITAEVTKSYSSHNGSLKVGSTIMFGPVGKNKGCSKVKPGKSYTLFLKESGMDNFFWISFNPVKTGRRTSRSLRKLLCKNCLVPTSFKKPSKSFNKDVGDKLKVKCKPTGKPAATISWFYNGELLTKANTPKDIKIKTRKKGGSSTLLIKKLEMKHNNNVFICSASNVVSESSANFTVKVKVAELCQSTCPAESANYCTNGGCCQMIKSSPTCKCARGWIGDRCQDRDIYWKLHAVNDAKEYSHQKRLVAILSMCLCLTFIMLVCLSAYYLFKKKRQKLLFGLYQSSPDKSEKVPAHLSTSRSSFRKRNSDPTTTGDSTVSLVSEVSRGKTKVVFACQDAGHENKIQPSPTNNQQFVRNSSLNGSQRRRLNGVAKDPISHVPTDRKPSEQNTVSMQKSPSMHSQNNMDFADTDNKPVSSSPQSSNCTGTSRTEKESVDLVPFIDKYNRSKHELLFECSRTYLRSISEPPITEELHEQYDLLNEVMVSGINN